LSFGQLTISTHSGLIQFTSGSVFLDNQEVHKTTTNSLEMKDGSTLRTENDGNAEVLLTPGVFLRIAPSSSVRMDSNSLSDTRVALLSGSAMVECDELLKGNSVAFTIADKRIEFRKNGLFRLEANPPAIAAIKGEAYVAGDVNMTVKKGKLLQLDSAVPQLSKLHLNKKTDELYQFSDARSADSAYATGVTASSLFSSGYSCTGGLSSGWYYMRPVGMYSYLPCSGAFTSPFGYSFLGLNNGYLWTGPNYYAPPIGLFGFVPGGLGRGYVGGGGGVVAGGGGKVPTGPANAGGKPPTPVKVPVFAGPAAHGPAPTITYTPGQAAPHAGGRSIPAMRGGAGNARPAIGAMAGPSMGRAARSGVSGINRAGGPTYSGAGRSAGAAPMSSRPSGGFSTGAPAGRSAGGAGGASAGGRGK
jgi:hypothetical protein